MKEREKGRDKEIVVVVFCIVMFCYLSSTKLSKLIVNKAGVVPAELNVEDPPHHLPWKMLT